MFIFLILGLDTSILSWKKPDKWQKSQTWLTFTQTPAPCRIQFEASKVQKTQSQTTSTIPPVSCDKATFNQTSQSLITEIPVYYSRHDRPRGWNVECFRKPVRFSVQYRSVWRERGPSSVIHLYHVFKKRGHLVLFGARQKSFQRDKGDRKLALHCSKYTIVRSQRGTLYAALLYSEK